MAGRMRAMAACAGIVGNRQVATGGPRVGARAVPGGDRAGVQRAGPAIGLMAGRAERPLDGIHAQKVGPFLMRVMATGALELAAKVQMQRFRRAQRIDQLAAHRRQRTVIGKRDRMIAGKIGAYQCLAGEHAERWLHAVLRHPQRPHRQRAIVTRQAQARAAGGLRDLRLERGAGVQRVGRGRQGPVPQRRLRSGVVWRVAKHAQAGGLRGFESAATRRREIVLGVGNGAGGLGHRRPGKHACNQQARQQPGFHAGQAAMVGSHFVASFPVAMAPRKTCTRRL